MKPPEDPKEEKALSALVTAVLHPFEYEDNVSAEEVLEFLNFSPVLTIGQRSALDALGADPIEWISCSRSSASSPVEDDAGCFAAMHRHIPEDGLDDETLREIERKRQEILKKLAERKKKP